MTTDDRDRARLPQAEPVSPTSLGAKPDRLVEDAEVGLSVDIRPLREAVAQLGEMWGEMERFVLRMLDGWSVILQRLALEGEQAATFGKWSQELTERLKAVDQRLSDLGASLRAVEAEIVNGRSSGEFPELNTPAGRKQLSPELPPLILPIRPACERSDNNLSTQPARQHPEHAAQKGEHSAISGPTSGRWENLMHKWSELAEKLDELLGQPPGS
ncbi:MAG: hypothetical protein RMJ16_03200 [Thermoguttaceae bacterium]|nr:hypothetical protein [Thermoguttaceae bacterium]